MTADSRWQEIGALFDAALERPRSERRAWLANVCAGDAELKREVGSMLAAHERGGGILERPIPTPPARPGSVDLPVQLPRVLLGALEGQQVGPYRLIGEIAKGGMGIIVQAHDDRLGRDVALKFLPPALRADPRLEARFRSEARAASALDHPNIYTIYDIGETEDGDLYIAMAYYPGETLAQRIAHGPLPVVEAIEIALQVARGLGRAHEANIIHRDVKPGNLMLTEAMGSSFNLKLDHTRPDRVKILDFGIAKLEGSQLTQTGGVGGTLAYMSPEMLGEDSLDARTDLWSLGVVLHEMLAGEPPFGSKIPTEVLQAILGGEPPPLRSLRPEISADLERVVAKALAKRPADRHASAAELAGELGVVAGKNSQAGAGG